MREGGWQHTVGTDLSGAASASSGSAGWASRSPASALAFGMDVVAWSQNLTPTSAPPRSASAGSSKDELLAHVGRRDDPPAALRAHPGLIGARRAGADEADRDAGQHLARPDRRRGRAGRRAARRAGSPAPALDVFDTEPLPADSPLRTAPHTVLTPHLGYVTEGTYDVFYREAVEDIAAWADGAPIREL